MCYTPPLYTNSKLTQAEGFTVHQDHPKKYDILPISVGTDPNLTLKTRRGTGYYKVPSLRMVWYRGMFGHSGWRATLEHLLDLHRQGDDYVPTGFKPYGANTYAVKGHPFGLTLSEDDRKALIAFQNAVTQPHCAFFPDHGLCGSYSSESEGNITSGLPTTRPEHRPLLSKATVLNMIQLSSIAWGNSSSRIPHYAKWAESAV